MKKTALIAAASVLALTLAGCGDDTGKDGGKGGGKNSESQERRNGDGDQGTQDVGKFAGIWRQGGGVQTPTELKISKIGVMESSQGCEDQLTLEDGQLKSTAYQCDMGGPFRVTLTRIGKDKLKLTGNKGFTEDSDGDVFNRVRSDGSYDADS